MTPTAFISKILSQLLDTNHRIYSFVPFARASLRSLRFRRRVRLVVSPLREMLRSLREVIYINEMSQKFQSEWWEVELPLGWTGEREEECATFLSQNEVGALQITAYRKNEELTDADLQEMAAEHIEAGAKIKPVQLGSFTGFYFHFRTEDAYWRWWLLRCKQTMLYATYNCDPEERGKDDEQVEQILATLEIR